MSEEKNLNGIPIGADVVNLSDDQVKSIEKWLREPEADLFINCIRSMSGVALLQASRSLIVEIIPDRISETSSVNLDNAHRLNFLADLLLDIRRGKQELYLIKLKLGE